MSYVTGALAGLLLGCIAGHLKNIFIWKKYLQKDSSAGAGPDSIGSVYGRMMGSSLANILTLAIAFFLMNGLPVDGIAFLVGTATALVIMNKVLIMKQKKWEKIGKEARES